MAGTSLFIVFLLCISSSILQTCSSQLLQVSFKPIFWENSQNHKDFAKMLLIEKCSSNLKDCAKGIPLDIIRKEISTTHPTGIKNTCNLKWLLFNTVTPI